MTLSTTANNSGSAASNPRSRGARPNTAPASGATAGSWSAPSPGSTSDADCSSATTAAPTSTKASSPSPAASSAGADSKTHCVRSSKERVVPCCGSASGWPRRPSCADELRSPRLFSRCPAPVIQRNRLTPKRRRIRPLRIRTSRRSSPSFPPSRTTPTKHSDVHETGGTPPLKVDYAGRPDIAVALWHAS